MSNPDNATSVPTRDKIETAARAMLHGVEMPRQLDFTSKKLYSDYVRFKTITKKILTCYEGLEQKYLVDKILMWMGPEACAKNTPITRLQEIRHRMSRISGHSLTVSARKKMGQRAHGTRPE